MARGCAWRHNQTQERSCFQRYSAILTILQLHYSTLIMKYVKTPSRMSVAWCFHSFSPDGSLGVSKAHNQLLIYPYHHDGMPRIANIEGSHYDSVSWSPDNLQILLFSRLSGLPVYLLKTSDIENAVAIKPAMHASFLNGTDVLTWDGLSTVESLDTGIYLSRFDTTRPAANAE